MSVKLEELEGGSLWRVCLATPKANIVDEEKTHALIEIFRRAKETPSLKAICLEGEGQNFSFGASVEEHLPDQVATMLSTFHGLFRAMASSSVVLLSAVRGQCLGGGLELVAFCHRVFASPDAQLGQPEIKLGVLAPVASVVLPERIGRAHAEELCLTGRSVSAEEGLAMGLVDEIAEDPAQAVQEWFRASLGSLSASSLRLAQKALRREWYARLFPALEELEVLYLEELQSTFDAREGVLAFLEKRRPTWQHS